MYEHPLTQTLLARLAEPVHRIQVLTGPRQVGKTTLVRNALRRHFSQSRYLYIGIDQPAAPSDSPTDAPTFTGGGSEPDKPWLIEQWARARAATDKLNERLGYHGSPEQPQSFILVLDEIQRIPDWSSTVKGLWDADRAVDRPMHVVILGSTPLMVQRGLTESLAGRFERLRMTHWSFKQMKDAFGIDLNQYIYFGGYPGSMQVTNDILGTKHIGDISRWKNYVRDALIDSSIKNDILMMKRVDKSQLLRRVFELGCQYSSQELSYNKIVGELADAGNTTTVAHYLDLLDDAGLLIGLKKYSGARHRRRSSSPKLLVHNTALMSALSDYTYDEAVADRTYWGRLAESAVGAYLINSAVTRRPEFDVYYWRKNSYEVDFVLVKRDKIISIEVKSGAKVGHRRGMEAFDGEFQSQVHRRIVISEQDTPLDKFLLTDVGRWFS